MRLRIMFAYSTFLTKKLQKMVHLLDTIAKILYNKSQVSEIGVS